jgi:hypothetical protein
MSLLRFRITHITTHSSRAAVEQLMGHSWMDLCPWLTCQDIEAEKAAFHKTFLLPVNLTCSSAIFSLAGRGVQQMVGFLRMQGERGLPYQRDAIIVKVRQDLVLDVSKSGSICLRLNKT